MDYAKLGLGDATSLVTSVHVNNWGASVVFSCIYDPQGRHQPYRMVFMHCRDIQILSFDDKLSDDATADLIGFVLGEGNNQRPAIITTDICEILISYDHFQVER